MHMKTDMKNEKGLFDGHRAAAKRRRHTFYAKI